MAITKEIQLKATDNFQQTEKSVGSLKAQLLQAQKAVADLSDKFGATSVQAIEAAKRASELKDKIGDAKSLTDAFNPDAKFKSLSASLAGVAGGYAAVSGFTTLLGVENKSLEEQLVKVQAAMAFSQGLQSLGESIDSFKQLSAVVKSNTVVQKLLNFIKGEGTTATVANVVATEGQAAATVVATTATGGLSLAMKVLRTAIVTTGIGALVVLVGYLVSALGNSKEATDEQKAAQERLNDEIERSSEILKTEIGLINDSADVKKLQAEIAGKSAQDLARIEREASDERIKAMHDERDQLFAKLADQNITAEQSMKINKRLAENQRETIAEINKQELARLELQKDAANKLRDEQKAAHDKEMADVKKRNEDRLAKEKELHEKMLEEQRIFNEKINSVILTDIDNQAAATVEKNEYLASLRAKSKEDELNDEYLKGRAILDAGNATNEERLNFESVFIDRRNQLTLDKEKEYTDKAAEARAFELEARQAFEDAKYGIANQAVGLLTQLAGKNKALAKVMLLAEKGLAVAQVITSASRAIAQAQANLAATPAVIGVVPNPMYAVQAAATAKGIITTKISAGLSIASILAQTIDGLGGKSPGGSGDSGGGGSTPAAPSFNIVGQNPNSQLAQSIANRQNQPVQAFVVGTAVTTQQARDRQIIQTATFN